jgi:hypothetical protein
MIQILVVILILKTIYEIGKYIYNKKSKNVKTSMLKWFTGLTLIMGAPGTGKTQLMAKLTREMLRKGVKVWSTEPIEGAMKFDIKTDPMKFNMQDGLVIIDEAGLYADSRDWKGFTTQQTMFFKLHRHLGLHIAVLSQDKEDADKRIRDLATKIYVLKKWSIKRIVWMQRYTIDVRESQEKTDIVKIYERVAAYMHGTKLFWISNKDRRLYNTYSMPTLPDKEWQTYKKGDVNYDRELARQNIKKEYEKTLAKSTRK